MSFDSTLDELQFFSEKPIVEAQHLPQIVTLVGPIRFWWGERWNTPDHRRYVEHRDAVRLALATLPDVAVYSPHRAFQGAWHPLLQSVNDAAIRMSDVLVDLTPPSVQDNFGTQAEIALAKRLGIPVVLSLGYLAADLVTRAVLTAVNA